jgi:hypothetical protein
MERETEKRMEEEGGSVKWVRYLGIGDGGEVRQGEEGCQSEETRRYGSGREQNGEVQGIGDKRRNQRRRRKVKREEAKQKQTHALISVSLTSP